ncbi:hypothetical protein D6827_03920 [Candidatus Parcubacteria bacterium]|nr:MAG: hypothetical protein D6827_03920 [Candidatus Parcubacteria bacterium]
MLLNIKKRIVKKRDEIVYNYLIYPILGGVLDNQSDNIELLIKYKLDYNDIEIDENGVVYLTSDARLEKKDILRKK